MLHNLPDEPAQLISEINALAEGFVTNLKRGKLGVARTGDESMSTVAAVEMTDVMASIVRLFQETEEDAESMSVQMLHANFPAAAVTSMQVQRLLLIVARTGDAMLRAQFNTLLLMNVIRRVLAILRDTALVNRGTETELEEEAKTFLEEIEDNKEEEEEESLSPTKSSTENSMDDVTPVRGGGLKKSATAAVFKSGDSAPRSRQGLSVRFAEDNEMHSANTAADLGGTRFQRTGSMVATEIPGQQLLRRAPSKREQSVDSDAAAEFPVRMRAFYQDALDSIDEFKQELEGMTEELCRRAPRQLHSTDTVITLGCSHTIRRYLLEAVEAGHQFKVIVLEGAPQPPAAARELALALQARDVPVQVLPDSSAFAVMGMCTKVLVSTENVLANGGMLAAIGTHMLCVAARHFSVPVMVATTTLKMSPYYPSDQLCTRLVRIARSGAQEMPWSTYGSPHDVLPVAFGASVPDCGRGFAVHAPVTEYVPPELIALYVTNETELVPSQIHRIVRANYSDAD